MPGLRFQFEEDLDDSESVEELVEEGQYLEGELVQGVESALPSPAPLAIPWLTATESLESSWNEGAWQ